MSKYKVCVYTICLNEEKFVDRWYESMREADEIYVLICVRKMKLVKSFVLHIVLI